MRRTGTILRLEVLNEDLCPKTSSRFCGSETSRPRVSAVGECEGLRALGLGSPRFVGSSSLLQQVEDVTLGLLAVRHGHPQAILIEHGGRWRVPHSTREAASRPDEVDVAQIRLRPRPGARRLDVGSAWNPPNVLGAAIRRACSAKHLRRC